jgi:hypothetical protein
MAGITVSAIKGVFNQPESDGSRTTQLHITHRHDAQGQYGLINWFLFFF